MHSKRFVLSLSLHTVGIFFLFLRRTTPAMAFSLGTQVVCELATYITILKELLQFNCVS